MARAEFSSTLEMRHLFLCLVILSTAELGFELRADTEGDAAGSSDGQSEDPAEISSVDDAAPGGSDAFVVYVIPIEGPIGKPTLFTIRSGIKDAIEKEASLVLFEMDTPGGELNSTLEIMKVIDRFEGDTATFINEEAISAGAIIASVTRDIYFMPRATMGSSEVVTGTGQDVDDSMKRKINAFLTAKVDAYTGEYRYRSQVMEAMIDPDVELVIEGETISKEGKLLNLNARRAHETYGDPPQSLLGSGIYDDLDALIASLASGKPIVRHDFETTWSLNLAGHLMNWSPVLLGLGILALLVEFKTPGFGVFGIAGIAMIAVVNFGHHVAGLSGYEGLIVFVIGTAMVFVELVFFPGLIFLALPGLVMMVGGLLWSMADIWPKEARDFEFTFELFLRPIYNLAGGVILAMVLFALLARFLPKTVFWDRMILAESVSGTSQPSIPNGSSRPGMGAEGLAVTDLFPTGEIEIDGKRYEAKTDVGMIEKGARVRVLKADVFGFHVEEVKA
jgi:membrane-bound serine protease (ClpP class)